MAERKSDGMASSEKHHLMVRSTPTRTSREANRRHRQEYHYFEMV